MIEPAFSWIVGFLTHWTIMGTPQNAFFRIDRREKMLTNGSNTEGGGKEEKEIHGKKGNSWWIVLIKSKIVKTVVFCSRMKNDTYYSRGMG